MQSYASTTKADHESAFVVEAPESLIRSGLSRKLPTEKCRTVTVMIYDHLVQLQPNAPSINPTHLIRLYWRVCGPRSVRVPESRVLAFSTALTRHGHLRHGVIVADVSR